MFSGSIPALVTPFRDGTIDEGAYRALIEWQIAQGSSAIVPCGTTGEAPTLSLEEHYRVIALAVEAAGGRVPVIAGCGSNDTATAVHHMHRAKELGADAALVVAPYYNRPSQAGIVAHFRALTDACDLPIIAYNVPGRTVTDILPETLARLAELPSVVGVKDASGKLERVAEHRGLIGPDFCLLSGNDDSAIGFIAMGGEGCISVSANVAPRLCAEALAAARAGDRERALALQDRLFPLHCALFSDASPGPVKYAVSRLRGNITPELRLPLTEPSSAARAAVDAALEHAGLL